MSPTVAAVILAGGTGARLGGTDKAAVAYAGRTLLERALDAVAATAETVVVGDPVPTGRPVRFTREDPPLGGPAAALLAGRDALSSRPELLVVLAVDMPGVTPASVERLVAAAAGHDGAFLAGADGRRQLAGVLRTDALDGVRPDDPHGLPVHRLLTGLDLVLVAALADEGRDIDTWADLQHLQDLREGACGDGG